MLTRPRTNSWAKRMDATRLFYGWVVVIAAFTVLCVSYGVQFSYGIFMSSIGSHTGWDRTSLSGAYSLYVFVYSALGLVSGRLTDLRGPKLVISSGAILLGAGLMLSSRVTALWQFYLAMGIVAAAGMSAAYVPCNATVVKWFVVKRGLALSVTSSGASFGMFVFPPLTSALIAAFGWRKAYLFLGGTVMVLLLVCAAFVERDPETLGLNPDGDTIILKDPVTSLRSDDSDWTLEEARRTRAFWMLVLIFALTWVMVFMPIVHIVPFALDLGIDRLRAAMTISVIGMTGFVGRLLIGTISDRFGRLPALGVCLFLQAFGFMGFTLSHGVTLLYTSAALFGISYGGITALFPALVGDFFGRAAIGAIVGFIFSIAASAAALGPLLAGYLYTLTRSYWWPFELGVVLNLIAASLLLGLNNPIRDIPDDETIMKRNIQDASRAL